MREGHYNHALIYCYKINPSVYTVRNNEAIQCITSSDGAATWVTLSRLHKPVAYTGWHYVFILRKDGGLQRAASCTTEQRTLSWNSFLKVSATFCSKQMLHAEDVKYGRNVQDHGPTWPRTCCTSFVLQFACVPSVAPLCSCSSNGAFRAPTGYRFIQLNWNIILSESSCVNSSDYIQVKTFGFKPHDRFTHTSLRGTSPHGNRFPFCWSSINRFPDREGEREHETKKWYWNHRQNFRCAKAATSAVLYSTASSFLLLWLHLASVTQRLSWRNGYFLLVFTQSEVFLVCQCELRDEWKQPSDNVNDSALLYM